MPEHNDLFIADHTGASIDASFLDGPRDACAVQPHPMPFAAACDAKPTEALQLISPDMDRDAGSDGASAAVINAIQLVEEGFFKAGILESGPTRLVAGNFSNQTVLLRDCAELELAEVKAHQERCPPISMCHSLHRMTDVPQLPVWTGETCSLNAAAEQLQAACDQLLKQFAGRKDLGVQDSVDRGGRDSYHAHDGEDLLAELVSQLEADLAVA